LKTKGRSRQKSAKRLQATEIVGLSRALRENGSRTAKILLDIRFFFAYDSPGRGNGKRLAAPLPLGSPEPLAVQT
jgi:hypothetical protein